MKYKCIESFETEYDLYGRKYGHSDVKVGDYFWEYNNGVGYMRKAHSEKHIKYFWEGYMTRAFFTADELLSVYPSAIINL